MGRLRRPAGATRDAQAIGARGSPSCTSTEEVDRVVLVYNRFVSALVQRVTTTDLLPIPEDGSSGRGEAVREERARRRAPTSSTSPSREEILAAAAARLPRDRVYRALLESAASVHGAQMTAMRNASKNAGELIDSLTLAMNRARQAEITQEILEVVAGADALTG